MLNYHYSMLVQVMDKIWVKSERVNCLRFLILEYGHEEVRVLWEEL
jgi:hypothetical protein